MNSHLSSSEKNEGPRYNFRKKEHASHWKTEYGDILQDHGKHIPIKRTKNELMDKFKNDYIRTHKINFKCPKSGERIRMPAVYESCEHLQCFDLEFFLRECRSYLKCPIEECPTEIRNGIASGLHINEFFADILYCHPDKTEMEIFCDGTEIQDGQFVIPKKIDDGNQKKAICVVEKILSSKNLSNGHNGQQSHSDSSVIQPQEQNNYQLAVQQIQPTPPGIQPIHQQSQQVLTHSASSNEIAAEQDFQFNIQLPDNPLNGHDGPESHNELFVAQPQGQHYQFGGPQIRPTPPCIQPTHQQFQHQDFQLNIQLPDNPYNGHDGQQSLQLLPHSSKDTFATETQKITASQISYRDQLAAQQPLQTPSGIQPTHQQSQQFLTHSSKDAFARETQKGTIQAIDIVKSKRVSKLRRPLLFYHENYLLDIQIKNSNLLLLMRGCDRCFVPTKEMQGDKNRNWPICSNSVLCTHHKPLVDMRRFLGKYVRFENTKIECHDELCISIPELESLAHIWSGHILNITEYSDNLSILSSILSSPNVLQCNILELNVRTYFDLSFLQYPALYTLSEVYFNGPPFSADELVTLTQRKAAYPQSEVVFVVTVTHQLFEAINKIFEEFSKSANPCRLKMVIRTPSTHLTKEKFCDENHRTGEALIYFTKADKLILDRHRI